MEKIRLGGIKILEGGAYLASSSQGEASLWRDEILSALENHKINLTFFIHLYHNQDRNQITAFCTEEASGPPAFSIVKDHHREASALSVQSDIGILSIFPHDQSAQIMGVLLDVLSQYAVQPLGLACSPSAISVVLFSSDMRNAIDALFHAFKFPSYPSAYDWYAAYEGRQQLLREIIASYQEKVIKIYGVIHQSDLELWNMVLPLSDLQNLAAALIQLGQSGVRIPFLVAGPSEEDHLLFALCLPTASTEIIRHTLALHLPPVTPIFHSPVAAFYIHGPHFGDRYGIANTLSKALQKADIPLSAISCAVSSISTVIRRDNLPRAMQVFNATFDIPKA